LLSLLSKKKKVASKGKNLKKNAKKLNLPQKKPQSKNKRELKLKLSLRKLAKKVPMLKKSKNSKPRLRRRDKKLRKQQLLPRRKDLRL
jgi:hypothetical protein